MRFLTYRRAGAVRHGYLDGDAVAELGNDDLTVLLRDQRRSLSVQAGEQVATVVDQRYPLGEVEVLAPVLRPGKLLAVAANYQDHVVEGGGEPLDKSTLAPRLFLKPPTCIAAPGADIELPSISAHVDWEAELVVVLGRAGMDVPVENALGMVAGYAVGNDLSARTVDYGYPRPTEEPAVRFFDWLAGKWPDGFCPFGPYLVSADEIADPQDLSISLEVNGTTRQQGTTKEMIFTVAELVAFASRLMTLEPGDVLLTGTPAGVGAATGEFLTAGDEMTVRIEGVGELVNRVVLTGSLPRHSSPGPRT